MFVSVCVCVCQLAGVNLAIMVAKVCKWYPNKCAADIVLFFFTVGVKHRPHHAVRAGAEAGPVSLLACMPTCLFSYARKHVGMSACVCVCVCVFVAYRAYIGGTSAPEGSMKELKHS